MPFATASPAWREIPVEPLAPAEAQQLARSLLADSPRRSDALEGAVARESSGNPFFSRSSPGPCGETATPRSPAQTRKATVRERSESVILARVARLAPGARRFLEIVAVAGRPIRFAVKEAADPNPRENVVEILRSGHLIRTRDMDAKEEVEAYHDRIREAVVASLSAEDAKSHHRRLAIALDASGEADPEWLALHWKEAGDLTGSRLRDRRGGTGG